MMKKLIFPLLAISSLSGFLLNPSAFANEARAMQPVASTEAKVGQISVTNAYARAVPPGQANSAAFMQIHNKDTKAHALVKAESSVSEVVELHTHLNEGGVMKMRRVEKIDLPAGKSVALKPGSFHIMLINLKKPLKINETVDLALTFEDGSTLKMTAPIQAVMAPMH